MRTVGPILSRSTHKLEFAELELPSLKPAQLAVSVAYAGVNRADVQQSKGVYPPPPGESDVLGLECSGVVAAIGPGVTKFKIGDRVMGLVGGGGFGTHVIVEEALCLPIPSYLSFEQAATLPESLFTFWLNAVMEAGLRDGHRFLTHGGAAGLGSFSVPMAKALGAKVVSSARGVTRVEFVRSLGADYVIDTDGKSVEQVCAEISRLEKVDVILDHIGADYFEAHFSILNRLGAIVLINSVGDDLSKVNLKKLVFNRLRVIGSTLRSRTLAEKTAIADDLRARALPLMEKLKVPVAVDSVIPVREIARAFERLESRANLGKIVLKVGE
jgi:NADPH2:quinone reductase